MKPFFDTSILVYAQQAGPYGARARALVAEGGVISIQVLNEIVNVKASEAEARLGGGF